MSSTTSSRKRLAPPTKRRQPRGRSGGRSGAAGYDFQDLYLALQLVKLLVDDREPVLEVIWEKKALEVEPGRAEPVDVDDVILRAASGREIYVQVKASDSPWSASRLAKTGALAQLWRQWESTESARRAAMTLSLATNGEATPLAMLADAARRSLTSAELLGGEASEATLRELRVIASSLQVPDGSPNLFEFLKCLHVERLPDAASLDSLIVRSLALFGEHAPAVGDRLLRLVAGSKHTGRDARAAFTRTALIARLREEPSMEKALIGANLVELPRSADPAFWESYREEVVHSFRTLRVYGLQVERAVFADLPSLFVPLRLMPLGDADRDDIMDETAARDPIPDRFFPDESRRGRGRRPSQLGGDSQELSTVLASSRRIGLIGGPGSGKTTTLKWLAVIAALAGEEGRETRVRFGLPGEPLVPVFVRFRRLAQRVRERGLAGIAGRAALVAEFLAAEFQAGLGGRQPTRDQSLEIAQEVLRSERTIFLFDALDEVPDAEMRSALFEAITDLLTRFPLPRVVLSSRPYAVRRDVSQLDLALFAPLPLDQAGRRTFARHWYRSVRTHLGNALTAEAADVQARDLARAAETMSELAETPLLLSILALVHFNRQGLPVERATLYDQATLAMLGHWERDPAGRDLGEDAIPLDWAPRLNLREREIRRVVECLAHDVQCDEGTGDFTEDAAVAALARGLEAVSPGAAPAGEKARLLLHLLVERSGLLQERSPGLLAFVHLSFQEYLAARALIGLGERALSELAALSSDGRHAEVVRLSVAILAADQRTESDERALTLIERVGERNALLAATCLNEAPRLALGREVAERLARVAMEGVDVERHYHMRGATIARVVWLLLERSERADDLLLEFLSYDADQGRRRPQEDVWGVPILGGRSRSPLTPKLRWFLERLSATEGDRRGRSLLRSLATLMLIEAGALRPEDYVKTLVWVMSWPPEFSESHEDRAAAILSALARTAGSDQQVRVELAERVSEGWGSGFRAANLLLSLGEPLTPDIARVLVQALGWAEHEELCPRLADLVRDAESRVVMLSALRQGIHANDADVRRGVARVLGATGFDATTPEANGDGQERSTAVAALLADPATGPATLSALGDELWDESADVAWRAAQALVEAKRADVPGVFQALVRAGLRAPTREPAASYLRELRAVPQHTLGVRAALLDALTYEEPSVVTASALLLLDLEDPVDRRRLQRLVPAVLRDSGQLNDTLPRLRVLLGREPGATREALAKHLATSTANSTMAGHVACVLAQSGQMDFPNLAALLVKAGLSSPSLHDEVIGYLKEMLTTPKHVTEVRKALVEGLESDNRNVTWGAVRCLWTAGIRTDAELPSALLRLLGHTEPEAGQACDWLAELVQNPWTSVAAVAAAEEALKEALTPDYRENQDRTIRPRRLERAWRIARVLVAIPSCRSDLVLDATILGGLAQRNRHDEAFAALSKLAGEGPDGSAAIESKLWQAVEKGTDDAGWGAVQALGRFFPEAFERATTAEGREESDERLLFILRALVREEWATGAVTELLHQNGRLGSAAQRALNKLARSEEAELAFAAACHAVEASAADHTVPLAIIKHGLGHWDRREKAEAIVHRLWGHPALGPSVRYALHRTTWGQDDAAASRAALLLLDHGVAADSGIVRGLTIGVSEYYRRRGEALRRLRELLRDPAARAMTIETLRMELYGEHPGQRFAVAALLVEAGVELDAALLGELGATSEHWPHGPLAILAHSDRAAEALEAAKRLGFSSLVRLLEVER